MKFYLAGRQETTLSARRGRNRPGCFVEMEIPTDTPEALENVLHMLLAPKRADRGEFFYVSPDEVATVAKIAGYEVVVPAPVPAAKSKHSGP